MPLLTDDLKVSGERRACDNCGVPVLMTVQRKFMVRRLKAAGREPHIFCDPTCNTEWYNRSKVLERLARRQPSVSV